MENGGMHHKRYDGRCTKQQVRIPKDILTSPILKRRSTCRTSSSNAFFMKHDMKVKVPNRNPKILIPSDGVVN